MVDLKQKSKRKIILQQAPEAEIKKSKEKGLKNQKKILKQEEKYRLGEVSIKDLISPSAFKVQPKCVEVGGKLASTMFVISYPRYISLGWFAPVITLNVPLDISMYFYTVASHVVLKQLKKKVGELEAQMMSDQEKGAPRDPVRETALKDIEKLRDDLTQGTEKYFQFALYITVYADNQKELDDRMGKMEAMLGSRLVYSKRVLYQAEQGFNSTLPMMTDEIGVYFNLNSSPCASSFPFISSDLTSDDGVMYGINRHNNSLVLFDRFSLQNANATVFATSGAGKSYAIKLEILRSMMLGTEVIVIDPENEYKYLSDAVGGTFIDVSLSSKSKINPFDLPRAIGGNDNQADIIRSAVITLKGLLKIMLGEFTPQEDALLDRALVETYAKKDITPTADLAKIEPPTLSDLADILSGMEGTEDLIVKLTKYTEGTFSGLLNNPTNIEMQNQLIVFSVRDLEDELRPMAIYTITNFVWNIVRSQMKRRILVIDEAWWLMKNEDSAKFVYSLVKRCRKYYLGVTTITQDVNDFLQSAYGKAIITNSAINILLKQSPASIELVQKTFMLTDSEKYALLESAVGEGIFFAGNNHVAIKVLASYTEDQIITTDPKQLLEIEDSKKEFSKSLESGQDPELEKAITKEELRQQLPHQE